MNEVMLDLAYGAALAATSPYFLYKMATTGKYREGLIEKLGAVAPRSGGPSIWVHGVSVGEVLSARGLVAGLEAAFPGAEVVISTTTNTGQAVAKKTYPDRRTLYFPLDFSWAVKRAFAAVRPGVVILMELEIWPNFLSRAAALGVPVVVANGRITERSHGRFKRLGRFASDLLDKVTVYLVQNEIYAERLGDLGVPAAKIEVTGNIKFDTLSADLGARRALSMRGEMGVAVGETLIIGGSTHAGEEAALLDAYAALQARGRRVRLLVVPRHKERFEEVAALVASRGYGVFRRSGIARGDRPAGGEVLLGDTMGELEGLYEAADVAFVGGSLIPHGGQNIMEPAAKGKPVVFGPSVENFAGEAKMLLDAGAATQISGGAALADALSLYLDGAKARSAGAAGRDLVLRSKGAASRTVDRIKTIAGARISTSR